MATTNDLVAYLSNNHVGYRIRSHVPTYSIGALATANHATEGEIAQNLVFKADDQYWMAVFPGDLELDIDALGRSLHADRIREVAEPELRELFPDCEPIPPFGNLYGCHVVADPGFERNGLMVFNACTRSSSLIIAWSAFRRLVRPLVARITEPAHVLAAGRA